MKPALWTAPTMLSCVALHPTEDWVVCRTDDLVVHCLTSDTVQPRNPPLALKGGIRMQFTPDGAAIASADDGAVRLHRLRDSRLLWQLRLPDSERIEDGEITDLAFSADGALLLVDAAEGPLPQTRFVLRKAFECGLKPIVVVNKIDRPDARPVEVLNAVFDLFVELDADDATLDFPTIYASGRKGVATTDLSIPAQDIRPLFDAILKYVPTPEVDPTAPLQMLVVTLDYSDYVGRIAIGRVVAGTIRKGQRIALMKRDGRRIDDLPAT